MKWPQAIRVLATTVWVAGCVSAGRVTVLPAVGPPPFETGYALADGRLAVYSAFDPGATSDPDASIHHSGYRIYSVDGKQLRYVKNWVGSFNEEPEIVSLAPGRYSVVARATGSEIVKVPVTIEAGKITSLRLDGSKLNQGRRTSTSDFVRLPGGLIVGWAAKENGEVK